VKTAPHTGTRFRRSPTSHLIPAQPFARERFLGRLKIGFMARGWESKSVEQQQEEFASNKGGAKVPLSSQQIAAEHERNGIELSRQHILQRLQVACNPRHRQMLEAALAELDRKLGR